MKKILCVLLSVCILFSVSVLPVSADEVISSSELDLFLEQIVEEYTGKLNERNLQDVVAGYQNSSEFRSYFNQNPDEGKIMIERAVLQQMYANNNIQPRFIYQTPYAKPFPQKNGYYCGPASVLTARVANGTWGTDISEAEGYNLQDQFAEIMGTTSAGTEQTQIMGAMNMAYLFNLPYSQLWVSSSASNSTIVNAISPSLQNGYACIINVLTSELGYYDYGTNHFITIYRYDGTNFGILDSNVNYGRAYYGVRSDSVNNVANAMRARGGNATITFADNFGDHNMRTLTKDLDF